eukprot:CAMPEP_0181044670 /NCGR_PEP_ID=MMETSP1070-20121207/13391_1 /TAXON_ID=265543 /ORGANISM="Minutocellus polymorphus, Strain NH13" /LENGTH=94 /DNA_ID=CAMNT_0023123133 /DNA_START=118 /DNA_END=399 /DNA_ORIENTATION=-
MTRATQDTAAASSSGADAAGGEAIYSSDGLPPLPAPVPPVSRSRRDAAASSSSDDAADAADADADADAVLDSDHMSPTDAFEVFGGRAYLRPGG